MDDRKLDPSRLHPFCKVCGWRKGGIDSWDGNRCKCGHWEPPMQNLTASKIGYLGNINGPGCDPDVL